MPSTVNSTRWSTDRYKQSHLSTNHASVLFSKLVKSTVIIKGTWSPIPTASSRRRLTNNEWPRMTVRGKLMMILRWANRCGK